MCLTSGWLVIEVRSSSLPLCGSRSQKLHRTENAVYNQPPKSYGQAGADSSATIVTRDSGFGSGRYPRLKRRRFDPHRRTVKSFIADYYVFNIVGYIYCGFI